MSAEPAPNRASGILYDQQRVRAPYFQDAIDLTWEPELIDR
jgi:hypothetical protein